jgi:dTDP-4-amino-4,6-dideoxygalactose transaminase
MRREIPFRRPALISSGTLLKITFRYILVGARRAFQPLDTGQNKSGRGPDGHIRLQVIIHVKMEKINHSKPLLGEAEAESLRESLSTAFIANGPLAAELGRVGASFLGMDFGMAVQSGTDALTLALEGLGVSRGAKIALPAYVCSAPLDALAVLGLEPVPVDVDRGTLAISPELIPKGVDAVVGAHLFGIPASLSGISGVPLVEDCAQTLGTGSDGCRVGSMGVVSVCSFYATKLLTSGHGGLVATSDAEFFGRMKELTVCDNMDVWTPRRHFRMSDLNAALALAQFERLESMLERRRKLAARFLSAMRQGEPTPGCVYSRFLVVSEGSAVSALSDFAAAGIEAKRPVYKPLFEYLDRAGNDFPNAAWAWDNLISVPLYPALTEDEVERIESFLEARSDELRRWPPA